MEIIDKILEQAALGQAENRIVDAAAWEDGKLTERSLVPHQGALNCYSIAKSVTSLLFGIAEGEGKISRHDTVASVFADKIAEYGLEAAPFERITMHHLLNQCPGIDRGFLFESDRYATPERDWMKLCLTEPYPHEPGEKFMYSNSNYYLLSCALHRAVGIHPERYLYEKLFYPAGIRTYAVERCPYDEMNGATGLYLSTRDLLRLGVLMLNEGEGLVPADYIRDATKNQFNCRHKYGYGFWIYKNAWAMSGAGGQKVWCCPARRFVFAAHAADSNVNWEQVMDAVFASL